MTEKQQEQANELIDRLCYLNAEIMKLQDERRKIKYQYTRIVQSYPLEQFVAKRKIKK